MKKVLAMILVAVVELAWAAPVKADGPILELVAQGRSVESAGGWGESVSARPGDTFLLWFVVKNMAAGTVAGNVRVKVDMPSGEANPLVMTVHTVADNAAAVTQNITVNLIGTASTLTYVPDGNAEVITNGVHTKVSPDQDGANMTTQYVGIGSINGGDFSYAKVLGTSKIAPRETSGPTPTPTVIPTEATASAVAKSTPSTGADEIIWPTLAWLGVGMAGYSIRKWANRGKYLE